MNLRSSITKMVNAVNPDVLVTVFVSTGYTIGAGKKQIPTYDNGTTGYAQVQAMNSDDIQLMFNGHTPEVVPSQFQIQGVFRVIFLKNQLHGIIRKFGDGGDIVQIGTDKYVVLRIIEQWPDWTKAALVLQVD